MAGCNSVSRTSLYAVAAKNASRVIDVVHGGVAFACGNPLRIRVFRGLDINTIGGTCRGAQKAPYALLEPVLVAMQYMNSAIPRLEMHRLVRVVFRHRFPENVPESDAKTFNQCFKRFTNFTQDGWHKIA